jgi:hypothetical protein
VRVGDRDGSSTMLFIDSENGVVDIGGEGSDNFVRVEPGKVSILHGGRYQDARRAARVNDSAVRRQSLRDEDLEAAATSAFFADEADGPHTLQVQRLERCGSR